MIEIRLLGPVELESDGEVVELGRPQQRLVLAVLAAEAGRVVAVDTMLDRVWDEAPAGARRALHVAITRLRRILERVSTAAEPVRLAHRGGGYVLDVRPDRIDLLRYRSLAGDPQRLQSLRQAMALWRGDPLGGLSGTWAARTRAAWRTQHLDTATAWARAELRDGSPAAALGPLTELADEHPMTESLTEVLMLALHATGRSADALTVYEKLRKRLAAELGVDPGPPLQAVYHQILSGAPATHAGSGPPVPRQLPAAVPHFVGRATELTVLNGLLEQHNPVLITAIGGTAGVGKTALAVHWANQVAHRFPDGQLYVNLRGFDPGGQVMDPAQAVRGFLYALGIPAEGIPAEIDAQTGLYRSLLAERRMLIVLDNARDAAHVRPLLPGAAGCLVVVTSRNHLSGLVAADGAHPVTLDLLTPAEAHLLLVQRLGTDRTAAEPDAVTEIITRCAHLPLALAVVAARAATHPHLPLRTHADELRETRARLDALTGDDPYTDVRAVLSWSYQALSPYAARLFRLLGLHPGPDITGPAAASLTALPPTQAPPLLAELTRMNLLVEHAPGRYIFHDLLRAYAAELTHHTDTDLQRHAATHRMLDHYLHTAHTADRLLSRNRVPITLAPSHPGVTAEHPIDHRHAMAWFTAEHPVLLAVLDHTTTCGFDTHTWQLAWALWTFLHHRGLWHDQTTAQNVALAAAQRLADPAAQAHTLRNLASADTPLGRHDDAHHHLQRALDLFSQTNDLVGQAWTHIGLGIGYGHQARHAEALHHGRQALDLYRAAGHRHGQARALNAIGWRHALLGDYQQALVYCQQSLTLCRELDDRDGQANAWDSLGYAHHHLGHYPQALTCYQHALDLAREVGNRYQEAVVLTNLADTHDATDNPDAARNAWHHARTILTDLNHPNAEHLRTKLATLPTPK